MNIKISRSPRRDLNPHPTICENVALSIELRGLNNPCASHDSCNRKSLATNCFHSRCLNINKKWRSKQVRSPLNFALMNSATFSQGEIYSTALHMSRKKLTNVHKIMSAKMTYTTNIFLPKQYREQYRDSTASKEQYREVFRFYSVFAIFQINSISLDYVFKQLSLH